MTVPTAFSTALRRASCSAFSRACTRSPLKIAASPVASTVTIAGPPAGAANASNESPNESFRANILIPSIYDDHELAFTEVARVLQLCRVRRAEHDVGLGGR